MENKTLRRALSKAWEKEEEEELPVKNSYYGVGVVDIIKEEEELDRLIKNIPDGPCKCSDKWVDEACVRLAISCWYPEFPLICSGCFWDQLNQLAHECVANYIEEKDLDKFLKQRARTNLISYSGWLFNIYSRIESEKRNKKPSGELSTKFDYCLRAVIKHKIDELVKELKEKDWQGSDRFNLRG
jgi:hypothetical protein